MNDAGAREACYAGHDALVWRAERSGSPLVFLHGFAGSPSAFAPVVAAVDALESAGRSAVLGPIVALASPGHARGTPAVPEAGWSGALEKLADAVASIAARPVHVCGYSLGARLGLGLVVEHRAVVERATLIGVNPGLANDADRAARRAADGAWAALLRTAGIERFVEAWESQPLFDSQHRLADVVREQQRATRRGLDPEQLARALEQLGLAAMPDYGPELARIDVPLHVVAGALDEKFTALAQRVAETVPWAKLTIVPRAGHNVVLERPEALGEIILDLG